MKLEILVSFSYSWIRVSQSNLTSLPYLVLIRVSWNNLIFGLVSILAWNFSINLFNLLKVYGKDKANSKWSSFSTVTLNSTVIFFFRRNILTFLLSNLHLKSVYFVLLKTGANPCFHIDQFNLRLLIVNFKVRFYSNPLTEK